MLLLGCLLGLAIAALGFAAGIAFQKWRPPPPALVAAIATEAVERERAAEAEALLDQMLGAVHVSEFELSTNRVPARHVEAWTAARQRLREPLLRGGFSFVEVDYVTLIWRERTEPNDRQVWWLLHGTADGSSLVVHLVHDLGGSALDHEWQVRYLAVRGTPLKLFAHPLPGVPTEPRPLEKNF